MRSSPFGRSHFRIPIRTVRRCVLTVAVALSVGMLPQYAPQAAARDGVTRPGTQTNLDDPVSGKNGTVRKYTGTDQAARAEVTKTAVVHWPEAASDEVTVGAKGSKGVQADGLP